MCSLPQRQFPERDQCLFLEEILQGPAGLVGFIHHAPSQSVDKSLGGDVDHHDFVGLLDHPIRHRFTDSDPGDVPDLIVEAFEVLQVHRGQHVDTGIQQHHDVFPTF